MAKNEIALFSNWDIFDFIKINKKGFYFTGLKNDKLIKSKMRK